MTSDIYTAIRGIYLRVMAPRPTGNVSYGVSITPGEAAVLEAERRRGGWRSLSSVLDGALVELLDGADFHARPLPMPASRGERLVSRKYQLPPATVALLKEAASRHRYPEQYIVRAAIRELERRAAVQGPTHTGR